jgi:hypothetical protein
MSLKKRYSYGLCAILLVIMLAGCAHLVQNSAATLSASKNFYDLAMTTTADLQKAGVIDQAKRDQINGVATIYMKAHNVAVDALITYNATNLAVDKDKLSTAILKAIAAWADVAGLVNAIKPGALPTKLGGGL